MKKLSPTQQEVSVPTSTLAPTTTSLTAREFAIQAHGGQKYGSEPYVVHLDHVAYVLDRFDYEEDFWRAAAYLHDVLEDTSVSPDEIARLFGQDVADVVALVTDGPGANRAERHAATYPRIRLDPRAVTLKLADRIANVERAQGGRLFKMYLKEHPVFREALYQEGDRKPMWDYLDLLLGTGDRA